MPQAGATIRLMISVAELSAHPGNVRADLNLSAEFLASIASEGVRIPLLVTPAASGGWRVIEGHRRLAAAVQAGLAEVPCHIDPGRTEDEAGQYVDMLLANSDAYRTNFTVLEEAAALFAAHEAGASRTRLRKATGRTPAQVKAALAAGGLPAETKAKAAELNHEVTLDDLALLAEFEGDQDATDRLLACMDYGYGLEHVAERIRQDRAEAAEHAKIRADIEAAGVAVTDRLPDGAAQLDSLSDDGQDLTPESHAACPGHGATFASWNLLHPQYYCASPAEHGHASRWVTSTRSADADAASPGSSPAGSGQPQSDRAQDPSRRLVMNGNKAWQAAAQVRHRWLVSSFFPRKTLPREAHGFLARQLLAMPDPLRTGLATATAKTLFTRLTGHDVATWREACDTTPAGRLAVIMLAPVITAYEYAMTEAEGRNTWRTDRYSPCPRRDAGIYLTFLAAIGYQLSAIEHAVADGTPYTGETQAADTLPESEPDGVVPDSNSTDDDGAEHVGPATDDTAPLDDSRTDEDADRPIDP